MPGVAALVNQSVAGDKSIQLFYNTNDSNPGLVLMSGDSSDDPGKKYTAKSTDCKGIIVNPSQLGAATRFYGVNLVVGITYPVLKSCHTEHTDYNVSIISPVYQPLATTEVSNTSIAVCSSPKAAFVYYLG